MARCEKCGAPLNSGEKYCPFCGSPVQAAGDTYAKEGAFFQDGGTGASVSGTGASVSGTGQSWNAQQFSGNTENTENSFSNLMNGLNGSTQSGGEASMGMKILSFLFPGIGLIMMLVNWKKSPEMARSLLMWVIAGFVKALVFSALDGSWASVSTLNQIRRVIETLA